MSDVISKSRARQIWLGAQGLSTAEPFGRGPKATKNAVEHLGYVQIDTISVIERSHHHILFTRIPSYQRSDLRQAQSRDKSVFEYWTHALSYVPTRDYRFFTRDMRRSRLEPHAWFRSVKKEELSKVMRLIREDGPISIRDIQDDILVDKDHEWGSRKPSKRALQLAFHRGDLTISERIGMLKKYELSQRHFAWDKPPKLPTELELTTYFLDRALRAQGLVSIDSICYMKAKLKPAMRDLISQRCKAGLLMPVQIKDFEGPAHWIRPEDFESPQVEMDGLVRFLSPFDPLTIQRPRLKSFFGHDHRFEAYVPKEKRVFGYFGLPVLLDQQIVAVLDLKADRANKKLLVQQWTWLEKKRPSSMKARIEAELDRFEKFQIDPKSS